MSANELPKCRIQTFGQPTFAFFIEDVGGWWNFKGIHVDREEVLKLLERFKHHKHCKSIVVLGLPGGHKVYEWADDSAQLDS
jgi:hypothetical protein